ncbi:DUF4337 domain-containing protein [Candidatus Methylacidiphilum fumarolicum]|uniref:DUF4337 domain-containing protein n=2 Tax=Candidatus Methylacidiphilum fumarolicum TaxID=591154 RepID=I0JW67_METFB|nr:DUF4337 domain-containing protein [Candidatus Methylacidiphilum fumarolicum]MBW6415750.1 DUF4337 domain-containing protein [Candidatus Methylacidiphilum fumarolicum]TFE65848.1 hypothetical protein A7K73_10920 [Candidatus Methylacidiphilum fumarolicum]TFE71830.1 DUF4337 domain-containing protein [Candidatus Methylacidiphilum fumarolicum]TFE72030.1 DUF4337 domain-containing protein [Candidatus Methylacidiphilum fumarolicum]TFE76462.1 hypothetical protein A7D33_09925 [Candidatus Methylacidiphi
MTEKSIEEKANEIINERLEEDRKKEKWLFHVSFSIILMAVLGTIVTADSENSVTEAIILRNEAVLYQDKATDMWNFFQAKSMRETGYRIANILNPRPEFEQELKRYQKEKIEIEQKAKRLDEIVEERVKASERYYRKHHIFRMSGILVQVGIALSSVSALMKKKVVWYLAISLATGGLVVFITAFLR